MAYLDQYVDGALAVDPTWLPSDETERQLERLLRLCILTLHVQEMKRRLGEDASPAELAQDKKFAKAAHNRWKTMYRLWGGQEADITEAYHELREGGEREGREGWLADAAQLDWKELWQETAGEIGLALTRIATHAMKLGFKTDGNKMVNRLNNEFNSLDDVLGDIDQD